LTYKICLIFIGFAIGGIYRAAQTPGRYPRHFV